MAGKVAAVKGSQSTVFQKIFCGQRRCGAALVQWGKVADKRKIEFGGFEGHLKFLLSFSCSQAQTTS